MSVDTEAPGNGETTDARSHDKGQTGHARSHDPERLLTVTVSKKMPHFYF
uniref:Uncharacterized protein n=1 Tax=Anguilla anguilla TaxID=7936 RepID=A0A0E9W1N0_ANGAN